MRARSQTKHALADVVVHADEQAKQARADEVRLACEKCESPRVRAESQSQKGCLTRRCVENGARWPSARVETTKRGAPVVTARTMTHMVDTRDRGVALFAGFVVAWRRSPNRNPINVNDKDQALIRIINQMYRCSGLLIYQNP